MSLLSPTVLLLLFSLLASASARREEIQAANGVVATDDGRCSEVGVEVLKEGGNAVDATVASAFCLGVVSPASSGIGGGGFMLIRLANGTTQAFDMREMAPLNSSADMYHGNETQKRSGILSVAVPGELAGLHTAWEQYGSRNISWKRLVEPAENFSRDGFVISPYLDFQLKSSEQQIFADEGLKSIFTRNGTMLKLNDTCQNEKLAETLRLIANEGPKAFYSAEGEVAKNLINEITSAGGRLNMTDLENYQIKIREPIASKFLDLEIIGIPPPSSGAATMMLMLNILVQYLNENPSGLNGSLGVHRKIEALKFGFAARANLGDPDFDSNVDKVVSKMLNVRIAKQLRNDTSDNTTFSSQYYGQKWNETEDHGTSHVSIVDAERNAVSITTSINSFFGSKILSPSTGIILNNQMDDFSMPSNSTSPPPAPVNFISPGKRPLSSMNPAIILKNGTLKAVLGASGGAHIIASTSEVFLNHFIHGEEPLDAVMAPRFYHLLYPNNVLYENLTSVIGDHYLLPADVRTFLQMKHHNLTSSSSAIICQFVVDQFGNGTLTGVSDPRKAGAPAGY
ncbi:Gamma-glutamyltranspeptidase [Melia azedarach]|uniref:Gamma-glutamyltranspeptidase n=1 Tax=Melia azedarach TaxID=155640 RepID=A0ACC1XY22_MELAZ|nr:Gamma-glutamyltranspeptidase [Melia azedarach]